MPRAVHRTAVFTIHEPTRHVRAALDAVFRQYTAAYTECLHACERHYDVETLLRLATLSQDERTGQPRLSARTLSKRLFSAEVAPQVARVFSASAAPLESFLRQSLREHVAQTLLSYALLHQAWLEQQSQQSQQMQMQRDAEQGSTPTTSSSAADAAPSQTQDTDTDTDPVESPAAETSEGVATGRFNVAGEAAAWNTLGFLRNEPRFPSRLRALDLSAMMRETLLTLATLADNLPRERELVPQLRRTRQPSAVSIPLVGLAAGYGGALYFNPDTRRFYARLDIVGSHSHLARPITARGRYIEVKSGATYVAWQPKEARTNASVNASADAITDTDGAGGETKTPRPANREDSANASANAAESASLIGAAAHVDEGDAEAEAAGASSGGRVLSFGRARKSVLVPLEMGRWHEWTQWWSQVSGLPVAYLPQRGGDPLAPIAATPVAARLVRHADTARVGVYRYELHVSFCMPVPDKPPAPSAPSAPHAPHAGVATAAVPDPTSAIAEGAVTASATASSATTPTTPATSAARPLLAICRGATHFYVAVVTTPDGRQALATQVASSPPLVELQRAHARAVVRRNNAVLRQRWTGPRAVRRGEIDANSGFQIIIVRSRPRKSSRWRSASAPRRSSKILPRRLPPASSPLVAPLVTLRVVSTAPTHPHLRAGASLLLRWVPCCDDASF